MATTCLPISLMILGRMLDPEFQESASKSINSPLFDLCPNLFDKPSSVFSPTCNPQLLRLGLVVPLWERSFSSLLFFLSMTLTQLLYDLILVTVWGKVGIHPEKDTLISLDRETCMTFWKMLLHCWESFQQFVFTTVWFMPYLCFFWQPIQIRNFCLFVLFFILHFPPEYFSWREMENSRLCKNIQFKAQHTFNILTWFQATA